MTTPITALSSDSYKISTLPNGRYIATINGKTYWVADTAFEAAKRTCEKLMEQHFIPAFKGSDLVLSNGMLQTLCKAVLLHSLHIQSDAVAAAVAGISL